MKHSVDSEHWHHLPDHWREWSYKVARDTAKMLVICQGKALNNDEEPEEERDLLKDALLALDQELKESTRQKDEATLKLKDELEKEQLAELREIRDDQKSLATYIMKREADLEKLQDKKERTE